MAELMHNEKELILDNTLNAIVKAAGQRVEYLLVRFEGHKGVLDSAGIIDLYQIKEKEHQEALNKMLDIFMEFQAMEKPIRNKHPQYNKLFNALGAIQTERAHGYFSNLRMIPGERVQYTPRKLKEINYDEKEIKIPKHLSGLI